VTFAAGDPFPVRRLQSPPSRYDSGGRRSPAERTRSGRYIRSLIPPRPDRLSADGLALDATLRAAAPHQQSRRSADGPALVLRPEDYREKVRQRQTGSSVLFVVDSSGSMGASRRMEAAKTAAVSLLLDAYRRRDRVGLIAFRGEAAELLLPPTAGVELAESRLRQVPTGGRTPLADALRLASQVMEAEQRRRPGVSRLVVLITDGHATVPLLDRGDPVADALHACRALRQGGVAAVVLDTETGRVRLGLNARLAAELGAPCFRLQDLRADAIGQLVARWLA